MKYRYCDQDKYEDILKPYKNILVDYCKDAKIKEKLIQLLLYQGHHEYIEQLEQWSIPNFPVNGEMLSKTGIPKGPIFSHILNELREIWKNTYNFNCNEENLLKLTDELKLKFTKK